MSTTRSRTVSLKSRKKANRPLLPDITHPTATTTACQSFTPGLRFHLYLRQGRPTPPRKETPTNRRPFSFLHLASTLIFHFPVSHSLIFFSVTRQHAGVSYNSTSLCFAVLAADRHLHTTITPLIHPPPFPQQRRPLANSPCTAPASIFIRAGSNTRSKRLLKGPSSPLSFVSAFLSRIRTFYLIFIYFILFFDIYR